THAVPWIQPEIWSRLKTRRERDKDVLRNIACLHAYKLCPCPVNVHEQRRRVERLLDVNIHGAGNVTNFVRQLQADGIIRGLVCAPDLNIDRCRRAEIKNLGDDIGRLKEKLDAGEL